MNEQNSVGSANLSSTSSSTLGYYNSTNRNLQPHPPSQPKTSSSTVRQNNYYDLEKVLNRSPMINSRVTTGIRTIEESNSRITTSNSNTTAAIAKLKYKSPYAVTNAQIQRMLNKVRIGSTTSNSVRKSQRTDSAATGESVIVEIFPTTPEGTQSSTTIITKERISNLAPSEPATTIPESVVFARKLDPARTPEPRRVNPSILVDEDLEMENVYRDMKHQIDEDVSKIWWNIRKNKPTDDVNKMLMKKALSKDNSELTQFLIEKTVADTVAYAVPDENILNRDPLVKASIEDFQDEIILRSTAAAFEKFLDNINLYMKPIPASISAANAATAVKQMAVPPLSQIPEMTPEGVDELLTPLQKLEILEKEMAQEDDLLQLLDMKVQKLALVKLIYGPIHLEVVTATLGIAQTYSLNNQNFLALSHAEVALKINQTILIQVQQEEHLEANIVQIYKKECRQMTGVIMGTIALIYYKIGRYHKAETILKRVQVMYQQIYEQEYLEFEKNHVKRAHKEVPESAEVITAKYQKNIFPIYLLLGKCAFATQNYENAEYYFQLAHDCKADKSTDTQKSTAILELGYLYLTIRQQFIERNDPKLQKQLRNLTDECIRMFEEARGILEKTKPIYHLDLAHINFLLVDLYFEKHEFIIAMQHAKRAYLIVQDFQKNSSEYKLQMHSQNCKYFISWKLRLQYAFACTLLKCDKFSEAAYILEKLSLVADTADYITYKERASVYKMLGNTLMVLKKYELAIKAYRQSLSIYAVTEREGLQAEVCRMLIQRIAKCTVIISTGEGENLVFWEFESRPVTAETSFSRLITTPPHPRTPKGLG